MNLLLRLALVLVGTALGRRLAAPTEAVVLHLRVLPNDLDLNLHMTNSRFLSVMDLGRVALIARSGLWRHALDNRWAPVVGGIRIGFRRSLSPLQRYRLETRIIGWTEHVMVARQRFLLGPPAAEELAAEAHVRSLFLHRGRKVPIRDLLATIGFDDRSPPLPGDLADWAERPSEPK